jgi:hypothetical protein
VRCSITGYLVGLLGIRWPAKPPFGAFFVLLSLERNNNKTLGSRLIGARWLVFGVVAILGLGALIYANPPTLGRAFKSNVVPTETTGVSDYKVTPDDLLW